MSRWIKNVAIACCVGFFATATASAWEIPLTTENAAPRGGAPPFASGGVPLLVGQAKEAADLHLVVKNRAGKVTAIPAQFRVLARWWRADNSIRWVLVDYPTTQATGDKKLVYLTDAKVDAPKTDLGVETTDDAIVVKTGAATFTINRKKFNFLQSVKLDGQEMVDGSPDYGTVIEDMFGEKYYSSEGTKSVEVIDSGPVRVCIRAQGQHRARGGGAAKGYSRGMYGYDITMNFYAGSADVTSDVIITNNFPKSIGTPLMKDASLLIRQAGPNEGARSDFCRLYGEAPLDSMMSKPEEGSSIALYQDSNGAETWQRCQGYAGFGGGPGGGGFFGTTTSFRGYRIIRRGINGENKEEVIASGDHARGLMLLTTGKGGVVMYMRNFWQQFPKAMEGNKNGTLRLGMFPRECIVPHYLEDCSAKGHEIVLHFYVNGKSNYTQWLDGRPWPHVVADTWDPPAMPRPPLAHICATGALCDLGPQVVPDRGYADYNTAINYRRMLMADKYYGNGFGWQIFGERWLSHGGHSSHGARQPISEDNYLYRYYMTGGPGWLDAGINRSRNFRDVRSYRIEGQDPFAFKNYGEFRKSNRQEEGWCSRPQPNDEESQRYQQGLWKREPWDYPNPEHQTLDLLYDRYLLFGDQRAFENMPIIAANGGFFAIQNAPTIIRQSGWSWRVIERYWELTGDKQAEELLRRVLKAYTPLIGKGPLTAPIKDPDPSDYRSWHTMIWNRPLAMTALQLGDPEALALAKAAAEGHEDKADYYCTLFAVLYHLTGEQKYKDAVMKASNDGDKLSVVDAVDAANWPHVGRMFPCSALWLLEQPPKKK